MCVDRSSFVTIKKKKKKKERKKEKERETWRMWRNEGLNDNQFKIVSLKIRNSNNSYINDQIQ